MNKLFKTKCLLEAAAGDPVFFLSKLTDAGVTVQNIAFLDAFRVRFDVEKKALCSVIKLAERLGIKIKILRMCGLYALAAALRKRFLLACGIAAIIFLTLYIPTRVFFVSVEGNERINKMYILEQAENVGIFFGASRKDVRSEQMKNKLLQAIPELKWAGINTFGCRAEIYVVERETNELRYNATQKPQGIYATSDGIVSSITVTKGSPVCKPGQAIRKGQLLVSGYTDCGLITRTEQAEATVRGTTQRRIDALAPDFEESRGEIVDVSSNWSLQIGKKQINLCIDSGNSGSECGKIYERYTLTLPGGFSLPVSVIKETVTTYETDSYSTGLDETQIKQLADHYISGCIIEGNVISSETSVHSDNGILQLTGIYTCNELIGKLKDEEIR